MLTVVLAAMLIAACGPRVPDAIRPTIDWLAQKGLPCTYSPPEQGSSFAQWTCRTEGANGATNVVVNGNERGVLSLIAQAQAPENGLLDQSSALAFLKGTAIPAPPNAGHQEEIADWLSDNPNGGLTTIGDTRVLYQLGNGSATLSFTYPIDS